MKLKKIWTWAIIFGLLASITLYYSVFTKYSSGNAETASSTSSNEENTEPSESNSENDEANEEEVEETSEEVINQMLPISEGKRAISIEVSDVQGVSGFIKPGSYVDLVAVITPPEEAIQQGQHEAAQLLLQNVKVLAVAHAADNAEEAKRYTSVTLEVTPQEGLYVGFATKNELYLMLRGPDDDTLEPEHTHVHEDELHEGVYR